MSDTLFDVNLLPLTEKRFHGEIYGNFSKITFKDDKRIAKPKTYYDHFISNGYEYIIVNYHSVIAGAEEILKKHNFKTKFDRISMEPLFLAYRETSLQNTYQNRHSLVMCIMVCEGNTTQQIENFFNYYSSQGVDKIFMYRCGNLADMPDYPQRDFVEYFEWDFNPAFLNYEEGKRMHYLQVPLYNMFSRKIAAHCDWTIYCDLDEYIYSKTNSTIKEHLKNSNKESHLFCDHRYGYIDFTTNISCYESTTTQPLRGKSIINTSLSTPTYKVSVHRGEKTLSDTDLILVHIKRNAMNKIFTETHKL